MTRVVVNRRAEADIAHLIDWFAERSPPAAHNAVERIFGSIRGLAEFPESGPRVSRNIRELVVRFGRDGYVVRYRVDGDQVLVTRVFHGRQKR